MTPSDPGFQEQFLHDMGQLQAGGTSVWLQLQPAEALTLVGQIRLALRHPGNRGASTRIASSVIDRLIDQLAVTETLRVGLQAGADPRHDTTPPASRGEAVVRPTVVCLCGSTRFKEAYIEAQRSETLCGRIVLSVGLFGHQEDLDMAGSVKTMLDELHLRKIDWADEILVLDCQVWSCSRCSRTFFNTRECKCGRQYLSLAPYIGESTGREIAYAGAHGKRIRYWSQEDRS